VWSVCLPVRHNRELCKNVWTDLGAVWDMDLGGTMIQTRNHVLVGGPDHPRGRGTFGGHPWTCANLLTVDIFNVIHYGTSLVQPRTSSLLLKRVYTLLSKDKVKLVSVWVFIEETPMLLQVWDSQSVKLRCSYCYRCSMVCVCVCLLVTTGKGSLCSITKHRVP